MINNLLNIIRTQASLTQNSISYAALGIVTNYDPNSYMVQVLIDEPDEDGEELQTGWIPIFSPWVGNGWGLFAPPSIGDLIEVLFQEGSLQAAYACLRTYTNLARPLNVPSGEFWLQHASGASLKFTNDEKILINGKTELNVMGDKITINVSGDCDILAQNATINSQNISLGNVNGGTLRALIDERAIDLYNTHTHMASGSPTSTPDNSFTGIETQNVKAT